MTQLEIIGKNIRRLREEKDYDQGELAEKLGISRKTVSAWENGKACPRMGVVEKMKDLFNCSINDIMNPPRVINERLSELDKRPRPNPEDLTYPRVIPIKAANPEMRFLCNIYNRLSEEHQKKLIDYALDLLSGPSEE